MSFFIFDADLNKQRHFSKHTNHSGMNIIADSGSTKTAWKLVDSSGVLAEVTTNGMNPFFRTTDDIAEELAEKLLPVTKQHVDNIWFYGAGVVSAEKGEIIREALRKFFPDSHIETHSDLLAACRALFGKNPGIACIVGTGSNACYFDGENIAGHISPLGFILGDEGSGAVMGKHLLGDYYKLVMPSELREKFQKKFDFTRDEVLNKVYREPRPNQFLATLVPFLSENIGYDYCQQFIEKNFTAFVERNILKLPQYQYLPVGFSGSVAWHFSKIMKKVLVNHGIENSLFIKDPIDKLVEFHNQNDN